MTRSKILLSLLAVAGLGVPAVAQAADTAPRQATRSCFRAADVENFSAADDRTVYLRANRKQVYRLDMFGSCPDVDWAWRIGIKNRGSSWICSAMDATLITRSSAGVRQCAVSKLTLMTPEEVEALPKRSRP